MSDALEESSLMAKQESVALKSAVKEAKSQLKKAAKQARDSATNLKQWNTAVTDAEARLQRLRSGRGDLLYHLDEALSVYEYFIEVPTYSGTIFGSRAQITQMGDLQHVSNVSGATKSGVGGAVAGGAGGWLIGGPVGGVAGAFLGNNMGRKTKIKTEVHEVDTRKVELEVQGPGYAWSTINSVSTLNSFRRFRDAVNSRGSARNDLKEVIGAQEAHVDSLRSQTGAAVSFDVAARAQLQQAQLRYKNLRAEYRPIKFKPTLRVGTLAAILSVSLMLLMCGSCAMLGIIVNPDATEKTAPTAANSNESTAEVAVDEDAGKSANPVVVSSEPTDDKSNDTFSDEPFSGVSEWANFNRAVGEIVAVRTLPDWAGGRAQQVELVDGGLMLEGDRTLNLYLVGDEVNIAYEVCTDGQMIVFGHYGEWFELEKPIVRQATDELPSYTVLFAAQNICEIAGNVLVPSMTKDSPEEERRTIFEQIAQREGLLTASFYSSEAAYWEDVNGSSAGITGRIWEGKFKP